MPGKCKQNPCASKPKLKPASAELFKQFPFKQSPGPLPRQLPSNWLQLKATFRISESRRASGCVRRSGVSSRWHFGYSRQGFLPACELSTSVSSSSHADVRLLSVCSETSTGQKRFLSICTSMFFDTQ